MGKKVLIIYPGALYAGKWSFRDDFRSQLLTLYSFLKESGIDVDVLDLNLEIGAFDGSGSFEEHQFKVKGLLQRHVFDIVGISCYASVDFLGSVMVAKICKELNPSCTVVVGGYHPTVVPEDFLAPEGLFDFVVKGEGEEAFLNICLSHDSKKKNYLQIVEGIPRDFKNGVTLDWAGYKYLKYCQNNSIGMTFQRGCPFKCAYCTESTLQYRHREYPVSLALRDIDKAIAATSPKIFYFFDPLFRVDTPWGIELLTALKKKYSRKLLYRMMTRIDLLTRADIGLLSQLNVYVLLGIETASEKMLVAMNKTKTPRVYLQKVKENLRYFNEKKILTDVALVFNYPGETIETIDETIAFLEETYADQQELSVNFHLNEFACLPGTLASQRLSYFKKEFGTVVKYPQWWKEVGNHSQMATDLVASRGLKRHINWPSRLLSFLNSRKKTEKMIFYRLWFNAVNKFGAQEEVKVS